jgi:hypothetical protein
MKTGLLKDDLYPHWVNDAGDPTDVIKVFVIADDEACPGASGRGQSLPDKGVGPRQKST